MTAGIKTVYAPGIDPFCWVDRKTGLRKPRPARKSMRTAKSKPYVATPGSNKYRIIELVNANPGMTGQEISLAIGTGHKIITSSLAFLVSERIIERDVRGNRGVVSRYYPKGSGHALS